jgi:histidinol-phosphate aminotransferase
MKKNLLDLIPARVKALTAYVPGKAIKQAQRESGLTMVKLASNENPFGPSPLAIEAIHRAAAEVHLYPDNENTELRWALAEIHGLPAQNIFVAGGSLGILDILARTLLGPGLNCVSSERSFISYPIVTRMAGGEYVTAPMRRNAYDLDAIAAAINDDTRVVLLANPNNPTGTMFDADALDAFLRHVPDHVLVVLDEAYYDFASYFATKRGIVYSRSLDLVRSGRVNFLVLRTFSKAHGLAGLRVGYACGQPELLQYFTRLRNAFSVSAIAEAAAVASLRDHAHIRKTLENNAVGGAFLGERLQELGISVMRTNGNFIYLELDEDANTFSQRMQSEGVIVRSLVPWGIPNGIRVTIGKPEENEVFLRAFRKVGRQVVTP